MKVQRQLSKIIGTKKYYKYVVVIPEDKIKKAGFKKGQEIKADVKKGEIKLRKKWANEKF